MFREYGKASWTCKICDKRMTVKYYEWIISHWVICELYHFFHCVFAHKVYPYKGIMPLLKRLIILAGLIIIQPIFIIIKLFLYPFAWLSERM